MNHQNQQPAQPQIQEEMLKQLRELHQMWLQDTTTQAYVTILQKRLAYYEKALFEHILQTSDKEFEDKYRSAISTTKTILKFLVDTELFIELQTKRTSEQTN